MKVRGKPLARRRSEVCLTIQVGRMREFNYEFSALSEPACAAFRGLVSFRALSRMAPIPSRLPAPHPNR
jgi:hypothetical protein